MSGETILRAIEAETATEAERIVASARERAARLVEEATGAARARVEAARQAAEPALRAEAARIVNAARLRLLHRRAELAAATAEAAWVEAACRLETIAAERAARWRAALARLTSEALDVAGPGAVVGVRAADASTIAPLVADAGGRLEPFEEGTAAAGPTVGSADGRIEVVATLPARQGQARTALAEEVASLLGLGE